MCPIDRVSAIASGCLHDIRIQFRVPVRITVLVNTGDPDEDFVMTDDDLTEVAAMVERAMERDAAKAQEGHDGE